MGEESYKVRLYHGVDIDYVRVLYGGYIEYIRTGILCYRLSIIFSEKYTKQNLNKAVIAYGIEFDCFDISEHVKKVDDELQKASEEAMSKDNTMLIKSYAFLLNRYDK
jgi:NH3-dependent NAD+ synthetase